MTILGRSSRERSRHRLGFYLVLLAGLALLGGGSGSPPEAEPVLTDEALEVAPVYIASPFFPADEGGIVPP